MPPMRAVGFLVASVEASDYTCLRSCLEGEDPAFRGAATYADCAGSCKAEVPRWPACLNVISDKFKNNTLTAFRCDSAAAAEWKLEPVGCMQNCTLRNNAFGLCLDSSVKMGSCDGADLATWSLQENQLRHAATGKCISFDPFADAQNYMMSSGWIGGASLSECGEAAWQWNATSGELQTRSTRVDMPYLGAWAEGFLPPNGGWAQWLHKMYCWREERLADQAVGRDFESYNSIRTKQSSGTYVTVQTMIHDRNLFDPVTLEWTAKRYLQDLKDRFGGVDQVLIWAGYPNLGVDTRSNFDLLEDLPGGARGAVQALKKAQPGLMVQLPYKPWDILTNGLGQDDPERLAKLLSDSGADGMNMDTMSSTHDALKDGFIPVTAFYDAAERAGVKNPTIEPEKGVGGLYLLNVTSQGWQYDLTTCYSCLHNNRFTPAVSTQKTLQRRSMPHICGRWAKQRSEEILTAYFNAVGYTAWENIWGIWNGFNDRDGQLLKRTTRVLRHFHPLISDPSVAWLPHYPMLEDSVAENIYASKFVGKDRELWLFINANTETEVALLGAPGAGDHDFFDMYHGEQLAKRESPACLVSSCSGSGATATEIVKVAVEGRGISAILRVPVGALSEEDREFMHAMRELTSRPLHDYSDTWGPYTTQSLVDAEQKASDLKALASRSPTDAVLVKGSRSYEFRIRGTMIEGFASKDNAPVLDEWSGADVQYPWESIPTKYHQPHALEIDDLFVDKFPITNAAFAQFLSESKYSPVDPGHFLRHWGSDGCKGADCVMPTQIARQPVVNIGIEDARAYCGHYGKRLPHEWEWQYAAQGGDPDRRYPWGQDWQPEVMPPTHDDASTFAMTDVGQFPKGASADGVEDLLGLIYHWTDEYVDGHTRRAVLRGSPAFQPQGWQKSRYQPWYFPGLDGDWAEGAPWDPPYTVTPKNYSTLFNLKAHGNYLLMTPSLDRAGTLGFRCVQESKMEEEETIV